MPETLTEPEMRAKKDEIFKEIHRTGTEAARQGTSNAGEGLLAPKVSIDLLRQICLSHRT